MISPEVRKTQYSVLRISYGTSYLARSRNGCFVNGSVHGTTKPRTTCTLTYCLTLFRHPILNSLIFGPFYFSRDFRIGCLIDTYVCEIRSARVDSNERCVFDVTI